MVELALLEVESADQGDDVAAARIQRHEGGFHFGQLRDAPGFGARLHNTDHRARTDLDVRPRLLREPGLGRLQAFSGNLERLAVLTHRQHPARVGLQHHG